jgi:hypothetical protein
MSLGILIADHHRKHRHFRTLALELHRTDCQGRHPTREGRVRLVVNKNWAVRVLGVGFDPDGQVHGSAEASASRAGIPNTLWRHHHCHGAFSCRG